MKLIQKFILIQSRPFYSIYFCLGSVMFRNWKMNRNTVIILADVIEYREEVSKIQRERLNSLSLLFDQVSHFNDWIFI